MPYIVVKGNLTPREVGRNPWLVSVSGLKGELVAVSGDLQAKKPSFLV